MSDAFSFLAFLFLLFVCLYIYTMRKIITDLLIFFSLRCSPPRRLTEVVLEPEGLRVILCISVQQISRQVVGDHIGKWYVLGGRHEGVGESETVHSCLLRLSGKKIDYKF